MSGGSPDCPTIRVRRLPHFVQAGCGFSGRFTNGYMFKIGACSVTINTSAFLAFTLPHVPFKSTPATKNVRLQETPNLTPTGHCSERQGETLFRLVPLDADPMKPRLSARFPISQTRLVPSGRFPICVCSTESQPRLVPAGFLDTSELDRLLSDRS
jgi:hypothetical protein